MSRFFTGVVGALAEAWQELRIHRTRVLLSLIGVAVAVCALTTVVGVAGIAEQAMTESNERWGGRPATLKVTASKADGTAPDPEAMTALWTETLERYGIDYAGRIAYGAAFVQFADGAVNVSVQAVDPAYAQMHRLQVDHGAWFAADDALRLAPAIVVNEAFWQRIGSPDLGSHPTVQLLGNAPATAVIVGVHRSQSWEMEPTMYMLTEAYSAVSSDGPAIGLTEYEMWIPADLTEQIQAGLTRDLQAGLGESYVVNIYRSDPGAYDDDPLLSLKLTVGGIAGLVLLLGALGLVNIAMVTVKQRIREIGIRRSFGATAGRVFFAVMLESVVATVAAGVVGVMVAIFIVKSPMVEDLIGQGMITDFPPFPIEAALLGLGAATVVGALAGLMPALVAVRVRVIDAIRY
ncbi:ABC transporter permease [Microterricola pindariensis]|uniref:Cell division protein FtsX n=1 Tax=Microterricola pindariensis TaxID=478010 RepID=A0ABX5AY17_9MICO|nr:ABC transporter permease [Microterricola pindariensis]PPL19264.1 cell division protein FtsX [Microterricola pindariensis]